MGDRIPLGCVRRRRQCVHECAGNSRGCANSHRGSAHHGVMKFAHGQRANKQVDVMLVNGFAAGGCIASSRCNKCDFRRVLTAFGFSNFHYQPHFNRAMGTNYFKARQYLARSIDVVLQLSPGETQFGRV